VVCAHTLGCAAVLAGVRVTCCPSVVMVIRHLPESGRPASCPVIGCAGRVSQRPVVGDHSDRVVGGGQGPAGVFGQIGGRSPHW
jgi:hypothetical protein